MTTLYWHRWRTRRGMIYVLQAEPWNGDESTLRMGDRFCTVSRYSAGWRYDVSCYTQGVYATGHTGSPARSRRIAEAFLDRNRVKLFGADAPDIDTPLTFI